MQRMNLFALFLILLLSACTGETHVDADGFFGRQVRNFYSVEGSNRATIISIEPNNKPASKYTYDSITGLKEAGAIPVENILISQDGKVLTVKGEPQVFEIQDLSVSNISSTTLAGIQSTMEAYCSNFPQGTVVGSTSYKEVQIRSSSGKLSVIALGDSGPVTLGSALRSDYRLETVYQVAGFGDFKVDLTAVSADDSQFFKTTVTHPDWFSATGLYCHLNRNQVIVPPPKTVLVSKTPSLAFNFDTNSLWTNLANITSTNGAEVSWDNNDDISSLLGVTGYFEGATSLPEIATIDGIQVNCMVRGKTKTYDTVVRLLKGGVPVGQNKAVGARLSLNPTLSGNYGGPSDLWGTTWTAADILSPNFGIQLGYEDNRKGYAYLQYCSIQVFWH